MATGIRQRHRKDCDRPGKCDCTWQAEVYDAEADVNAKALSTSMGHSTIAFTLDKYGHLMPGKEDDAADLLDA